MSSETADYSCPHCGHSSLEGEDGIFECPKCGQVVTEYTDDERKILEEAAQRNDDFGALVRAYLDGVGE